MKTETKMTPELIRKWVHALESGEYRQGFGALLTMDGGGGHRFCSLGVLGSVAGIDRRTLANNVRLERLRDLLSTRSESAFVRMNDEVRMSFHEIASVIRDGCPWVFEDEEED